jgi:hypothetical protein
MQMAGCRKLVFGFETASLKLIQLIDKRIDLAQAEKVMKWCNELGIWVDLEVIVGLSQEKSEDFNETVNYVVKNMPYINYMTINEFFVVPASLIGCYPERYGIEIVRTVSDYENILSHSWNYFKQSKGKQTGNFKIYKYNEVNGRNHLQVAAETKGYIKKMNDLQRKEFAEVESVYRIFDRKS